jgi:beta-glucanase (GH16 family)
MRMRYRAGRARAASTFRDEFDGPAGAPPDPAKWSCELGGGGWGNGEAQEYVDSPSNVFQDGKSHLIIRATRHPAPAGSGEPDGYHSARITTRGKFWQLGGTFEARIKVVSQPGLWPAFWLMGQNLPQAGWPACGEVDILEDFGYSTVQASVHAPAGGDMLHSAHHDLPSDTGWHTYQLRWAADGMSFSRDGRQHLFVSSDYCPAASWVYGPSAPSNGGMFLLLNLAVGGNAGDPPPGTVFPADLMIDYVRVSES